MILEIYPSGPLETNAILIGCPKTKEAALIDAPLDVKAWLFSRLKELDLHLGQILLTHSHLDHIADAADLKEELNAKLYVHEADAGNLMHPGSDGIPLFFPVRATKPDGFLLDGQRIHVGELTLEVIHTPGHTPGGVCFYLKNESTLISGDTLFQGTIGNLSFPTARPSLMWASLKRLAKLPAHTRVIPGHGDETTIEAEYETLRRYE